MKEPKVLTKRECALSHGFIIGGLVLLSVGLALGPGRYVGGLIRFLSLSLLNKPVLYAICHG